MLAFGGNGPLFAAGIAAELGIARIIIPPLPGVFSAFGLLVADAEHHARQSIRVRLDAADPDRITEIIAALTEAGAQRMTRDGFAAERQIFQRAASARYAGQSSEIEVALPDGAITPALIADAVRRGARKDLRLPRAGQRAGGTDRPVGHGARPAGTAAPARTHPAVRAGRAGQPRAPGSRMQGWVETPVTDRAGLTGAVGRSADHPGIRCDLPGAAGHDGAGGRFRQHPAGRLSLRGAERRGNLVGMDRPRACFAKGSQ